MQHRFATWRHWFAGTDPGRIRLTNAVLVAVAVVLSTTIAWLLVRFAHADHGLLAMGGFMALQMGLMVKDRTHRDRLVTTALLPVSITLTLTAASLLSHWRAVEVAVFIGLGGLATWLRRFGPRVSALGTMGFFAYFFALFLRPDFDQLPQFILVGVTTAGSVLGVRAVLGHPHPRTDLTLLLNELRATSDAALSAAQNTAPGDNLLKPLHARIERLDAVGRAIDTWQDTNGTERYICADATEFSRLVLQARLDVVHACLEIAQLRRDGAAERLAPHLTEPGRDLSVMLDGGSSPAALDAAAQRAAARLHSHLTTAPEVLAAVMTDRSVLAFAQLRGIDLTRPLPVSGEHPVPRSPDRAAPHAAPAAQHSTESVDAGPRWKLWRNWSHTTRSTVQVVAATALATVVGEAISADRWYWAVLTAFIVFVGTTTRGAILTRAARRVIGTLAGVLIGFGLTLLINDNIAGLIALCAVAVFCTLYFGPLQYTLQAFFLTIMLTSMYGLLGVLNRHILELRLAETAAGAVIGVVCAYILFSTSSRGELTSEVARFFDAVDALLDLSLQTLTSTNDGASVLRAATELDVAQAEVATLIDTMSATLIGGRHAQYATLEHLMRATSHYGGRLAKIAADTAADTPDSKADRAALVAAAPALTGAVAQVRATSAAARAVLLDGDDQPATDTVSLGPTVLDRLPGASSQPGSALFGVGLALTGMNWALQRAAAVGAQRHTARLPGLGLRAPHRNVRPSTG